MVSYLIMNNLTPRKPEYLIDPLFLNRWSPRAMSGEGISKEELFQLFEAGRWAPSSYNAQPWRFVYVLRDSRSWQSFFDLLVPFNQVWCRHAAALVLVLSRTTFEHNNQPSVTHSFDTGAAWENIALQGSILGLVVHGMQGFDYNQAGFVVKAPVGYVVEMMFAVGKKGKKIDLPVEIQEKEFPSLRKPLTEVVFEEEMR